MVSVCGGCEVRSVSGRIPPTLGSGMSLFVLWCVRHRAVGQAKPWMVTARRSKAPAHPARRYRISSL